MDNPSNIHDSLQQILYDIKAEAVIGDFIENGLKTEDFIAIHNGSFKRRYARDISSTETLKLKNGQHISAFYLNRDGLYDSLPEGLFHKKIEAPSKQSDNISEESKKLKVEEKATRDFFLPFENEVFFQRVLLELEERKILNRFNENLFNDIYPEFWNFDISLDKKYISKMVLLLHFSHLIAGKPNLIAKCLQAILNEKVEARIVNKISIEKNNNTITNANGNHLGLSSLGVDFICGSSFNYNIGNLEINIGPLKNTDITEFLENGPADKFLKCFCSYFVPAEIDFHFNISVGNEKMGFMLAENMAGNVLGYETAI